MAACQHSIGRSRAQALFATEWWLGRPAREIAKFQLLTMELCLPFEIFHRALEDALGRPVWIHELGFGVESLAQELFDERDAPSLDEILDLVPVAKKGALVVD